MQIPFIGDFEIRGLEIRKELGPEFYSVTAWPTFCRVQLKPTSSETTTEVPHLGEPMIPQDEMLDTTSNPG
jgi:hypothetical protein